MPDNDEHISKGCEFGRMTRVIATEAKTDVNKVVDKLNQIYTLLITTLVSVLGSVVVGVIVFWATVGHK